MADAILQRSADSVEIGGKTYKIASPSIATLILVSEAISTLPIVDAIKPDDPAMKSKIFASALHNAKDFRALGDIAAILILGAKGLHEEVEEEIEEPILFGLFKRKVKRKRIIDRQKELAKTILESVSSAALYDILLDRINLLDIGNFFAITTSLSEANILKPTRGVEA